MSETQFTPGPWGYDETTLSICRLIVTVEDVQAFKVSPATDSAHAIAYVPCDAARDVQEANARLITAAPDLLALALEVVRLDEEDAGLQANDGLDVVNLIAQARAVIAKATEK